MQCVVFSLFGSDSTYCIGAVRNAALIPTIYPGWRGVFFVDNAVPKQTIHELKALGCDVRDPMRGREISNGMFWRFCIANDSSVERFIIRDCDSRVSLREKHCVDEWIKSGLKFHSIRDHPAHTLPMGGGLWGAVEGAVSFMPSLIRQSGLAIRPYERGKGYGLDQTFLSRWIWPKAKRECMQHDSCNRALYPDSVPFPDGCKFGDDRFVGEIFNANDEPHELHWQQRINSQTL